MPSHTGVPEDARRASVRGLDQLLADLTSLRALYKHFHWRVAGRRFIMLHELYDEHAEQLAETIDAVAERIQTLGGLATAWPGDVAELTRLRPPSPATRSPDAQLRELLDAHAEILAFAHDVAARAADDGDHGTNDLIVAEIIRAGQKQAWFVGEHLDHVGSD